MKLREIPDMERYLKHDCYCPGEIYDISGFFYQVYEPEDECLILEQNEDVTVILADLEGNSPQAIYIWHDDPEQPGKIIDTQRVDGTKNNIEMLKSIANGQSVDGRKFDEFRPGSTEKALDEVMSLCDAVMFS